MKVWRFFRTFSSASPGRVLLIAGIAGLSNALLLVIVNSGAHSVSDGELNFYEFVKFGLALLLFVSTQRHILHLASIETEKIVRTVRVRLAEKIRASDLQALEGMGRARLYASVNRDTLTISQAAMPLMIAAQSSILVTFSFVYIFTLSPMAFVLTVIIVALGIAIHLVRRKELNVALFESLQQENAFFDGLTHLLDGFKEVKLNAARSLDLSANLSSVAGRVADFKTKAGVQNADYYILTQVLVYVLIGAMVFVLPRLSLVYSEHVTQLTAAILFIIGPLSLVVSLVPVLRGAEQAIEDIAAVEGELDRSRAEPDANGRRSPVDFQALTLRGLTFEYPDPHGAGPFTVGPIDLTIRRGETLLLIGGNGSGKSTFLKLLTGLYHPAAGQILVDDVDIRAIGQENYRELFAAVFSDYHLFDRLYGMSGVEPARVQELLRLMQLDRKTLWVDGRFANQDLSTGQRKRLALIVSLLEDKPIYVFDEWAADQDPTFRRLFYESLLPMLKAQGKTIIAATHDDRYFHVGDRVLAMEFGRFVEPTPREVA